MISECRLSWYAILDFSIKNAEMVKNLLIKKNRNLVKYACQNMVAMEPSNLGTKDTNVKMFPDEVYERSPDLVTLALTV